LTKRCDVYKPLNLCTLIVTAEWEARSRLLKTETANATRSAAAAKALKDQAELDAEGIIRAAEARMRDAEAAEATAKERIHAEVAAIEKRLAGTCCRRLTVGGAA
jgi:hypothetical protein